MHNNSGFLSATPSATYNNLKILSAIDGRPRLPRPPAMVYTGRESLSRCETPARSGPGGASVTPFPTLAPQRQGVFFVEGRPMEQPRLKAQIMDEQAMARALTRIAHEIIERNEGASNLALVGIVRRGAALAPLLADEIAKIEGTRPPVGTLDVSFYRDDVRRKIAPVEFATDIPFDVDARDIVLVDDVLYTGRTIRAALDALIDLGRPRTVQLAVMVDRGHRELPIRADYVGKNVPSSREEDVRVSIAPYDSTTSVEIWDTVAEKNQGGAN